MSNIIGTGTTFNLPNYAGQLYTSTPAETPFLNLIANKAVKTDNYQFATGTEYAFAAASQPAISENGSVTAPDAVSYVRSQETNVTQIFQEKISLTYSKLSNSGRLSGVTGCLADTPENYELEFQTARALEKIARDVEYTFINGVYQLADSPAKANKTRGIINACGTVVNAENQALTSDIMNDALKQAYEAGASFSDTVLLCNASVKQKLTSIYAGQWGFAAPPTRNVGGVNIVQIETDFGVLSVMLSRFVPAGTIIGADISCIRPVEQDVPDKGSFFREALSKNGAADEYQIFGQIGLDHGPMWNHFKITNIA